MIYMRGRSLPKLAAKIDAEHFAAHGHARLALERASTRVLVSPRGVVAWDGHQGLCGPDSSQTERPQVRARRRSVWPFPERHAAESGTLTAGRWKATQRRAVRTQGG